MQFYALRQTAERNPEGGFVIIGTANLPILLGVNATKNCLNFFKAVLR